jgi:predicted DNA-binding transcriptional regulator AlpA
MHGSSTLIPTLEELARDPARAAALPSETVAELLARCATAQGALLAALMRSSQGGDGSTNQQAEVRLLTVDEAATKLAVTREWLYRRGKGLGLAAKLSDGTLRFSNVAVEAYIRAQTIPATALPVRRRRKTEVRELTD